MLISVVYESQTANSPRTCCDETIAKGTGRKSNFDLPAMPAGFNFSRRSCPQEYRQVVKAPGARQTFLQRRIQNGMTTFKPFNRGICGYALQKLLRRDASPANKKSLKMVHAQVNQVSQFFQRRLFVVFFRHEGNHSGNAVVVSHVGNITCANFCPTRFLRFAQPF